MKKLEGKKLWLLVTAIGLAVVAVIAAIWLLPLSGSGTQNSPEAKMGTKIPEVIPSNADTVVIAPAYTSDSQTWWESVSSHIDQTVQVENVKPYEDESFEILNYGYSRSVNPSPDEFGLLFNGPDQAIYLESKTEEGAAKVHDWLTNGSVLPPEADTATTRVGTINIIARKVALDHLTIKNKELNVESILKRDDFKANSPMMWVDFNLQQKILATGGDESKAAAIKTMFTNGLGISDGTVWQSTSADAGKTWNGTFTSGGVKKEHLDPKNASLAFESDAETLQTSTNRTPNAPAQATTQELSIVDPGLSRSLDYISIQYADTSDVIGNIGDNPPAGKNVVSADLSLVSWNNLTQSTSIGKNGYETQSIRATENDLTMHFE